MTYANVSDVSTRLGRPISTADEIGQVNAWLEDVEALITARIPTLATLVAAGTPSTALVVMVEANAVVRKVKNPDGLSSETVDDYTYRRNDDARRGELFLTDDEWVLLMPTSGGAFSVSPFFEPDPLIA
jgi:hypothetical protein